MRILKWVTNLELIYLADLMQQAEIQQKKLKTNLEEREREHIQNTIANLYRKRDALYDEKLVLIEKLFAMQENFIRKLDQQIEKTEENKAVADLQD